MKYKDQEILSAIRNGNDRKALEALYSSVFPKIKKLVRGSEESEEETKDVLQEALLIFYKQVMTNKFDEKHDIGAFIYTVAKNLWINRIKKKKRQVNLGNENLPEQLTGNVLEDLEFQERKKLVQRLFNQLDEKCKELLTYTIFEELSMKEISEKMGFSSANAATVASFRCKKFLMDLVKKNKSIHID